VGAVRFVTAAALACAALAAGAAPALAAEPPLVVRTSAPATVRFGDQVQLRVTVLSRSDAVDAGSIRVTAPLVPFTQLEPTRVTHGTRGALDVATFEVTAACLDQRCVAASGPRVLRLPPVHVTADAGDSVASASASWPQIPVRGRVAAGTTASASHFRSDVDPPPVTYRVAPDRLSTFLVLAAAGLLVAAAALAALEASRIVRRRREVTLTELERALVLARQAEQRPPADRRRAVGLLARVLGTREGELADEASTLAWSRPEPTPQSVSTLVDDVANAVEAR
jgi:hypothetical protein